MEIKDISNEKKEDLLNSKKYPPFLTNYEHKEVLFIAFDIFDYAMSINNGELRNKIYYCQYNNFDNDK